VMWSRYRAFPVFDGPNLRPRPALRLEKRPAGKARRRQGDVRQSLIPCMTSGPSQISCVGHNGLFANSFRMESVVTLHAARRPLAAHQG